MAGATSKQIEKPRKDAGINDPRTTSTRRRPANDPHATPHGSAEHDHEIQTDGAHEQRSSSRFCDISLEEKFHDSDQSESERPPGPSKTKTYTKSNPGSDDENSEGGEDWDIVAGSIPVPYVRFLISLAHHYLTFNTSPECQQRSLLRTHLRIPRNMGRGLPGHISSTGPSQHCLERLCISAVAVRAR